jgi:UDP-N-acetylmuramoyl-L-alanyl-D-glutamate--2,6-diaminopimelate ligase
LKSILEKAGNKVGLLGTIEYIIGERQIPAPVTTPESYDLQHYFSQMLKEKINYAVMEVSSHSLILNRVFGVKFNRAVFTNITRDHLDFHKTSNRYRQAKGILFERLSSDNMAVLNLDDPASKYYANRTPAQIMWYHLIGKPPARMIRSGGYFGTSRKIKPSSTITTSLVQAEIEGSSLQGNSIILKTPIGEISINSPLIGQYNVYNILAASAAAISLGISVNIIKEGIESVNMMRGRLELVETNTDYSVMVDFAHTDDALRNILCSLKPIVKGRIITVFGCGGDRDRGKRPLMGKVVSKYSDLFVITSDNPRSEDPLKIIKDIKRGIKRKKGYYIEPDRYEAIKKALSLARENDLVLIAGKGHETYQIFKDTVKPFDDCETVKSILSK